MLLYFPFPHDLIFLNVGGNLRTNHFVIMNLLLQVQDRNALQSRIVNSPFYSGQTTFGGASAYRKLRDSFQSPSEVCCLLGTQLTKIKKELKNHSIIEL